MFKKRNQPEPHFSLQIDHLGHNGSNNTKTQWKQSNNGGRKRKSEIREVEKENRKKRVKERNEILCRCGVSRDNEKGENKIRVLD